MTLSVVNPASTQTFTPSPSAASDTSSDSATPSTPRAPGDSQLVQNFLSALNSTRGEYAAPIQIPPNSTLGQWRTQLAIALSNPDFQHWLKSKGIAPASIVILPDSGAISAAIHGQRRTFSLTDNSGWSTVAGPILSASKVIASGGAAPVHYNDALRDTFELGKVAHFYGLPDLTKATTDTLERTHAFAAPAPTDTYRSPSIRGEQALSEQQRTVADIYKRHEAAANPAAPGDAALVEGFTREWQKKIDGLPAGLIAVPPQTVLGQWLGHYRNVFESPVVQNWLREQKIDPATVKIVPSTGAMSAKVDGVEKQFSLNDTSGWRQIAGPLLDAASVIAPAPKQSLNLSFGTGFIGASMKTVATFYGEPNTANVGQSQQRVLQLNRQKTFDAPPNEKQSIDALETQRAAAGQFYTQAPQKLAYTKLATGVAQAMPNLRAQAKQLAENILREHLPKDQLAKLEPLDADKLYLHRFHGGVTEARARSGWEHPGEEPHNSKTLTEAVLSNFSEHDWDPGELDSNGGIYTEGPGQSKKNGYGAHNEFPFSPSVFMRGVWSANFQGIATKKIDEFWNTHESDFRAVAKGEFVNQARQQLKAFEAKSPTEQTLLADEHKFSRDDYKLVMGAVSNVAADENTPITVDQLRAEAPAKGKLRAHAFDINGYPSNIIRFADLDDGQYNYENNRRDGRQILWLAGATPAFLRFDSLKKMDDWVVDQAKDPQKRAALASHFSAYNRQDGGAFGKYGVDSSLAHLASGDWENWEGKTIDRGDIKIENDVFTHLKDEAKARMTSDADTAIKSDSEVSRDTWLNDISVGAQLFAKLAPLGWPLAAAAVGTGLTEVALGAEKAGSGDTQAERKDGAWKTFDGTLNTLFSAGASGAAKDPFELPQEKLPTPEAPVPPIGENPIHTPQADGSGIPPPLDTPPFTANRFRRPSSSLIKMNEHAVPNGEQFIANTTPDALGVYRVTDSEGKRWNFVRHTDETGSSKVFEIESRYRMGDSATSIISPATGRAVMRVHPGRDGEWVRAPADGGMKWPWQRSVSPTPSDDPKIPRKPSDGFEILGNPKTSGADKFDELLVSEGSSDYQQSVSNLEEAGVLKRKLSLSWTVEEEKFEVYPSEKAQVTEHSSTPYSPNFIKDLNRDRYTVRIKERDGYTTIELNGKGSAEGETLSKRLRQFEDAISNPALRTRISEVAHQGSVAPISVEMKVKRLQEHVGFAGKDTHYLITYDPALNEAQVRLDAEYQLSDLNNDSAPIPNVDTTAERTFTIRENNELSDDGNPYAIDKNAPFTISISSISDLK
jgi:hypothetical protein